MVSMVRVGWVGTWSAWSGRAGACMVSMVMVGRVGAWVGNCRKSLGILSMLRDGLNMLIIKFHIFRAYL